MRLAGRLRLSGRCRADFPTAIILRCGAMARFSPIMRGVVKFAQSGGLVLGICNGFQILCEAGLLPGALGAQRRPAVCLPAGVPARRRNRHAVYRGTQKGPAPQICPSNMARAVITPTRAPSSSCARTGKILLRYVDAKGQTDGGGQSQWLVG